MESAIGRTVIFGANRKMEVLSETVKDNGQMYSYVTLKGARGAVKTAIRYWAGNYRIVD